MSPLINPKRYRRTSKMLTEPAAELRINTCLRTSSYKTSIGPIGAASDFVSKNEIGVPSSNHTNACPL